MQATCGHCGASVKIFSYCKTCDQFATATLALDWTVRKITAGAKAGKWALISPLGETIAYYGKKAAALKDCAIRRSLGEAD